jgi:carbamoyl-phosphate synthase large subunit
MNVLILSAAAKVLLVRAFAEAAHPRGGEVFAADVAPDSAALFVADHAVLLPRSDAPEFAPALVEYCRRNAVRLVVPTRDGELSAVAAAASALASVGAVALVASQEALEVCQDKRRFVAFCAAEGLATPRTYEPGEAPDHFPVFVRPVRGAGGNGARKVAKAADLASGEDLLIQVLETAPEYSVDVLMDLSGQPLQAVARRRILVRDGEAVKSRVESVPDLEIQALKLCSVLGLVGHNVVQAFWSSDGGARFIEVNPRFGGASNLSIQAGLASPSRLLQLVAGEAGAAAPRTISYGLTLLRYAEDRLVTDAELATIGAP